MAHASTQNPQVVLSGGAFETQMITDARHFRELQKTCNIRYFRRLNVLGGSLIRVYTQYEGLVGEQSKTDDYAYGDSQAQQLMQRGQGESAISNSDSYNLFRDGHLLDQVLPRPTENIARCLYGPTAGIYPDRLG